MKIPNLVLCMHMKSGKKKGLGPYPPAVEGRVTQGRPDSRWLPSTEHMSVCFASGRAHLTRLFHTAPNRELKETAVWG